MKKEKRKKKYKREKRRNKEEERKKERRRKNFCDVRNVEMLSRNSPRHNFNDRQPTSQKGEQCFEVPPLAVHYFFPRLVFSPRILRLSKKKMEKNTATNISIPSHFKKTRPFDPGQKGRGGVGWATQIYERKSFTLSTAEEIGTHISFSTTNPLLRLSLPFQNNYFATIVPMIITAYR